MIVNDLEIILRSTLLEFDKSENYNNEINALGNRVFFWGMNFSCHLNYISTTARNNMTFVELTPNFVSKLVWHIRGKQVG